MQHNYKDSDFCSGDFFAVYFCCFKVILIQGMWQLKIQDRPALPWSILLQYSESTPYSSDVGTFNTNALDVIICIL